MYFEVRMFLWEFFIRNKLRMNKKLYTILEYYR